MAEQPKTVLVTGATRGIGLALVALYKTNGWNVIATARNLDTADKLKALAPTKIVELDTSNEASILKTAKELEGEPIDLLINNAGIAKNDTTATATKESIMKQFEVNAVGPFLVTRALLPNLRAAISKHGSASVGHITSIMGSITVNGSDDPLGGGGLYGYRASKTALNMINSSLAIDLKKDKITSVVLHPGYVSTDMTGNDGEITTKESVEGLCNVLGKLTLDDTGKFFMYDGTCIPW